jgi:hypothetical protein
MSFRDSVDRIEEMKDCHDKVYVWHHSTGWPVRKDDLESFLTHMDTWYSILNKQSISRSEYEELCRASNIEPTPDDEIGGYGDTYGDFGMCHYHTVPKNRQSGIRGTLNQKRWFSLLIECPNIKADRKRAYTERIEALRVEALRKTYPIDLEGWIEAVGGLDKIYERMVVIHSNNSHQLRESGRHFEWLIGHASKDLGFDASRSHSDYVPGNHLGDGAVYPLLPEWWAGWDETDEQHPINRIAVQLSDHRGDLEPYKGKIVYYGYGEDCGDEVRKEWLGL